MGSSYFAPLTLFYSGITINPQIASEYYYYLSKDILPLGVLISQSGESSETVWNLEKFYEVTSITNNPQSTLATAKKTKNAVMMYAGEEKFSSTKTYVNTLLTLYCGFGIDTGGAIQIIMKNFSIYQNIAKQHAFDISKYINTHKIKGLYVLGSGPNIGTAYEAALTLSETTKLSWIGMPVAQYDHGPKETADDTIIIVLNGNGKDKKRIELVKKVVKGKTNALIVEFSESILDELMSPLSLIIQANFLMNYLADEMKVGTTFEFGGKITRVDTTIK
jgi:glucosamine--fructose-6-phosphate aminotransferase (isomerizing)